MSSLEDVAINTYKKNMDFLKEISPSIYEKVNLFETALSLGEIQNSLELEYKEDSYFDIKNLNDGSYLYSNDSLEYSKRVANGITFDLTKNSFKTFREYQYDEKLLKQVDRLSILSSAIYTNAPIIDYVNKNTSEERVAKKMFTFTIFGTGLGIHIPLIHNKINASVYFIVEPNLEIFRLSLFVTDYTKIASKSKVVFSIAEKKEEFHNTFETFQNRGYMYNHYIKFCLFSKACESYFEEVQNALVSQSHLIFSYDRELSSFSKSIDYLENDYNFLNISTRFSRKLINNFPILILAAGPSFKKNVEFVRENQDKFIIVAVLSLCPLLKENGIEPDILTNYDEQSKFFIDTYKKIDDKTYFDNKVMIFGSHLDKTFVNLLPKENIYFFQAIAELKKNHGTMTSPSIGEMTYALSLIFNFKEIYLVGLDLALDPDTGKSHSEGYNDATQFESDKDVSLENFSLRKNELSVRGNFCDTINTLPVFAMSIKTLNRMTQSLNKDQNIKVYNLCDGAYFENIEPLRAAEIDMGKFETIDKSNLYPQIKDFFETYASSSLSSEEVEFIENKVNDVKELKHKINKILSDNKHSRVDKYFTTLSLIHKVFQEKNYACIETVKVMIGFYKYNLPYIFYFLNLTTMNNPKSHIKKLNKIFLKQLNRILDLYIERLSMLLEKKVVTKSHYL